MPYFLVHVPPAGEDRDEETAEWLAKAVAVAFHQEVAVRAWAVDLGAPYIIETKGHGWHRCAANGNPLEDEEGDSDVR